MPELREGVRVRRANVERETVDACRVRQRYLLCPVLDGLAVGQAYLGWCQDFGELQPVNEEDLQVGGSPCNVQTPSGFWNVRANRAVQYDALHFGGDDDYGACEVDYVRKPA